MFLETELECNRWEVYSTLRELEGYENEEDIIKALEETVTLIKDDLMDEGDTLAVRGEIIVLL